MSEAIIKAILDWNPWLQGDFPDEYTGVQRDYDLLPFLDVAEIKILEGVRRSGKSTLMYQVMKHLHHKGEHVLYLNFDDEELNRYPLKDIFHVYEQKQTIQYLFLDEIQRCTEWVPFVRKLYDTRKVKQIWISGSNSSLIKQDYKTLLTGRNITLDIFPLSFKEFLYFHQQKVDLSLLSYSQEAQVIALFQQYVQFGAFPAIALRQIFQKELLINYFEDILYKDIMTRHNVDARKLKDLAVFLCSQSAKEFSYRSVGNILKLHSNTVTEYLNHFKETFLFDELYRFDYSLKQQILANKKIYAVDVGIAAANAFLFSDDMGRKLENIVYSQLKRNGHEIYFHRHLKECDFIVKEDVRITQAIQVTCSLQDHKTKQREIAGLQEAMQTYSLKEGFILTVSEEETLSLNDRLIRILPIWKWLLLQTP